MKSKKLEKFEDWLEKYPKLESLYYPLWRIYDGWKYDLKNFYYRHRYGYEPWQVWNFNSYAVDILLPNLRRFVESQRPGGGAMGCPGDLFDNNAKNDECHRWREELEEILWAFEWYDNHEIKSNWPDNEPYNHEKEMADGKRAQAGFEKFGKYLMGMWD